MKRSARLLIVLLPIAAGTASAQSPMGARNDVARATVRVIDSRTLELECTFPALAPGSPRPIEHELDGLRSASVPGTNLVGFSIDIPVDARIVSVLSVVAADHSATGLVIGTLGDAPITADSAADRAAAAALEQLHLSEVYPREWAEVTRAGRLHAALISTIRLFPYRYRPATGTISCARIMRLRIALGSPLGGSTIPGIETIIRGGADRSGRSPAALAGAGAVADRVAPDGFEYKIFTDRDAVYRLTARDLLDAGLPLDRIDARTLRLTADGIEQPIYVFDRGNNRLDDRPQEHEYIEFFGWRRRALDVPPGSDLYFDPHTRHSVFFLTWGGANGKRLVEESGAIESATQDPPGDVTDRTQSFRSTIHLEEDATRVSFGNAELNTPTDRYDRWMWTTAAQNSISTITARVPAPQRLFSDTVRIRASLRGTSVSSAAQQPHGGVTTGTTLFVGGFRTLAARVSAVGLGAVSSDSHSVAAMTADRLGDGNMLSITLSNEMTSEPTVRSELSLNWVELTYPRTYTAVDDSIEFTPPAGLGPRYYTFRIRDFRSPDIRLYRMGISRIANAVVQPSPESGRADTSVPSYDLHFQAYAASETERFYATTETNILTPLLVRDEAADLRSTSNDANYIVILADDGVSPDRTTPASDALRRFAALKERRGVGRVLVARASDVYDEFGGGSVSPLAIKRFLRHAYRFWSHAPRFALLIGEGEAPSTDRYGGQLSHLGPVLAERDYIPSIMMQTVLYGATECDYLFGCIEGDAVIRNSLFEGGRESITDDLVAEIAVGRLPMRSAADLSAYVSKLEEQEENPDHSHWRGRTLFVGGWEATQTEQLQSAVTERFRSSSEPLRMFAADAYAGSRFDLRSQSIIASLNRGVGLVTYLGHGGGRQWEAGTDLSIETVSQIDNRRRMPPVLSLTCFTGTYSAEEGLIARMIAAPMGGALVAIATPGYGWLMNNGYFADAIFSVMHEPRFRDVSFGELMTIARARYIGTYQSQFPDHVPTVAAMYAVFGDPSVRAPFPGRSVALRSDGLQASEGGSLSAQAEFDFSPTAVHATLFDSTETEIPGAVVNATLAGSLVNLSAVVPPVYGQNYVGLRVFGSDQSGRGASGSIRFPLGDGVVADVKPIGVLSPGSDARFEVAMRGNGAADSLTVTLRYATPVLDRVQFALRATAPGRFESEPVPGNLIAPGGVFELELPDVREVTGRGVFTFYIEGGADPAAHAPSALDSAHGIHEFRSRLVPGSYPNPTIRLIATESGPRLSATVFNWGDKDAAGVDYRLVIDSLGTFVELARGVVDIPAHDSAEVRHDVGARYPSTHTVRLQLLVDSLDTWKDSYQRNNEAFSITSLCGAMYSPAIGFTSDGVTRVDWVIPPVASASIDGGGVGSAGLATARVEAALPRSRQPWRFLALADPSGRAAALVVASDHPALEALLELSADTNGAGTVPLAIARFDETTRLWLAFSSSSPAPGRVLAKVPLQGTYAVVLAEDLEPPSIRFSVEGQFYADSSSVASDARFAVVISDQSGINTETIEATIDGRPLEQGSDFVVLDSTITATSTSLRVHRETESGRHTLCVSAADRYGNLRKECTSYEVSDELEIRLYGNYPNPFVNETFIAYELRGATIVDEVEVKIFSTAGRLVRTFRWPSSTASETEGMFKGGTGQPNAVGYHEVWWDGLDDRGREAANGVYFYRVLVATEDESVETTGTLARVR